MPLYRYGFFVRFFCSSMLIFYFFGSSHNSLADDKLPRGKDLKGSTFLENQQQATPPVKVGQEAPIKQTPPRVPAPVAPAETTKVKNDKVNTSSSQANSSCGIGLLNYPGRLLVFSSDSKKSYHILQKTKVTMADYKLKVPVAERYSEFYQYNYEKNELHLLKKAVFPKTEALMSKGTNPHNFILLGFTGQDSICTSGEAQVFQLPILKSGNTFQVALGQYSLVQSEDQEYMLYDELVHQAVDVDPKFFQFRKEASPLAKGIRPLFIPKSRNAPIIGVSIRKKSKYHEVLRFRPESKSKTVLNIAAEERIIYDHGLIGSARIDEKNNTLILREIEGWSGEQSKLKSFKIVLPKEFTVSSATVRADFARRKIIILGMSEVFRKSWRKAFLVDYSQDKIGVIPLDPGTGNFFGEIDFHPDGSLVIANVQEIKDGTPIGLLFYDLAKNKSYLMNFKNAKDIREEMQVINKNEVP